MTKLYFLGATETLLCARGLVWGDNVVRVIRTVGWFTQDQWVVIGQGAGETTVNEHAIDALIRGGHTGYDETVEVNDTLREQTIIQRRVVNVRNLDLCHGNRPFLKRLGLWFWGNSGDCLLSRFVV